MALISSVFSSAVVVAFGMVNIVVCRCTKVVKYTRSKIL